MNIPPFDPIHAKEVLLKRGGPTFGYRLKLKNVMESGWKLSDVTKFKYDGDLYLLLLQYIYC